MAFIGKLAVLVTMGFILGLLVASIFNSPHLGLLAFLLWCVSNRKKPLAS